MVDEYRKTLYALSRDILHFDQIKGPECGKLKSMIILYDLGGYGEEFQEIGRIKDNELFNAAAKVDERVRPYNLSIAAIKYISEGNIQLVVITTCGTRFYISFHSETRSTGLFKFGTSETSSNFTPPSPPNNYISNMSNKYVLELHFIRSLIIILFIS